jgi:hypothetical protein
MKISFEGLNENITHHNNELPGYGGGKMPMRAIIAYIKLRIVVQIMAH